MGGQTRVENVKGYLFNLIVLAEDKSHADYLANIVQPFIEKFPCRTLFIELKSENGNNGVKTSRNVQKKKDEESDHLRITFPRSERTRIPFAILPKLVPDLPIYLILGGDPTADNETFRHLKKWVSKLVFDSAYAQDLHIFSEEILKKISELKIDFMDISWAKISGWRRVLSQVFNSSDHIDYLNRLKNMHIKYSQMQEGHSESSSYQAIYLQAWLASELKWEYQTTSSRDPLTFEYLLPSKQNALITLTPQERPSLPQGSIFEIEIHSQDETTTMMTLAEKQSKVQVYVSTPEKCNLPLSYSIPDLSKGLTIIKEVFYYPTSEHYRKMLQMLKNISFKED